MNEEILKLAKECGYSDLPTVRLAYQGFNIEAFYRAAFNAGIKHAESGYPDAEGNHDVHIMGHYVGRGRVIGTLQLPKDCWRKMK